MDEAIFNHTLVQRYLENKAAGNELELFYHLVEKGRLDSCLTEALNRKAGILPADEQKITSLLNRQQPVLHSKSPVRINWFRYAAAVILVLATGAYLWFAGRTGTVSDRPDNQTAGIMPGGTRAILTLADGSTILLDSIATGKLADQGATQVLKEDAGSVSYTGGRNNGKIIYNTISTPRGGQYKVVLPDGSKAWLNAASSIHFPVPFSAKERSVDVSGEVYLEVEPDKDRPFTARVKDMEVEVLGTAFNIMAYDNEATINTTLFQGSVSVIKQGIATTLKAGEQLKMPKITSRRPDTLPGMHIFTISAQDEIAWKNNLFIFDNNDIGTIFRQLERWYDVEFVFNKKDLPDISISGKVSRSVGLYKMLDLLESITNMTYKPQGRKIIVSEWKPSS